MTDLNSASFGDGAIEVSFLQQIGEPGVPDAGRDAQIAAVAERIAAFLTGARTSLDLAIYDFRLDGGPGDRIVAALRERARAGVAIRIAHDPTTSPGADVPGGDETVVTSGGVQPAGAEDFLARLDGIASVKPIKGFKSLMHNKYVIRDGLAAEAAVLMGSTNFTNDAWGLQENNIVILHAPGSGRLLLDGFHATVVARQNHGNDRLSRYRHGPRRRRAGHGCLYAWRKHDDLQAVVNAIELAEKRLTIAAMVMSSGPIAAAVSEAIDRGVPVVGLYDGPQMDTVLRQWAAAGNGADKANTWRKVAARLSRKDSIPRSGHTP